MTSPLEDPLNVRILNLLGGSGAFRRKPNAKRLRELAEWLHPTGSNICIVCDAIVTGGRRDKKYCSAACRKKAHRMRKRPVLSRFE